MIEIPTRSAYVKTLDGDAGVLLAPPERPRGTARVSAFLVSASYCTSAAVGAIIGGLITGHPATHAISWLGHGSVEGGGITLVAGTVLLHWPFKWAIDHWW